MHENLPATCPCRVFRLLKFDCSLSKYHEHCDMRSAMARHCLSVNKSSFIIIFGNTRGLNQAQARQKKFERENEKWGMLGNVLSIYLNHKLAVILSGSWPLSIRKIWPPDPDPSPPDSVGIRGGQGSGKGCQVRAWLRTLVNTFFHRIHPLTFCHMKMTIHSNKSPIDLIRF